MCIVITHICELLCVCVKDSVIGQDGSWGKCMGVVKEKIREIKERKRNIIDKNRLLGFEPMSERFHALCYTN